MSYLLFLHAARLERVDELVDRERTRAVRVVEGEDGLRCDANHWVERGTRDVMRARRALANAHEHVHVQTLHECAVSYSHVPALTNPRIKEVRHGFSGPS